ncbi:MAG: hypothetical protein DRO88_11490 [Promethearchaeia archaeon]|nr:MAG: hypothetical protein DRO88_11490 [Candidatus Lokiarchaeia archaeon]
MQEPNPQDEKREGENTQNQEDEVNSDLEKLQDQEMEEKSKELKKEPQEEEQKELQEKTQKDSNSTLETEEELRSELLEFSEIDHSEFTDQDLADIEEAIAENIAEDGNELEINDILTNSETTTETEEIPFKPEIDADLEARMAEEIKKKKQKMGVNTVSKEKFIEYLSSRRNKIVYHALWHLVFNVEDHEASKQALYEALKEVTSKNPVEPIEEHKFYFGLGFILRLQLYDEKVVQFKKGKLTISVNPEHLKEILSMVGDPISDRPILTKTEKKKMFQDFLKDEFLDI